MEFLHDFVRLCPILIILRSCEWLPFSFAVFVLLMVGLRCLRGKPIGVPYLTVLLDTPRNTSSARRMFEHVC